MRQTLETAGIRVLDNEAISLTLSDRATTPLYIAGVGSRYAANDKTEIALAQVPDGAARIVFMHEPDSFPVIREGAAPLALDGHTHGGQVRIPFTDDWSWMSLLVDKEIHGEGWIEGHGQQGNRLYVNRGIGFSNLPIRTNCRPELTNFTLRANPD